MRIKTLILCVLGTLFAFAQSVWQPDILGAGFEMRYVVQPDDYSGPVRSTVVRYEPDPLCHTAVLYVHGFNDYFYQAEMAREFHDHGYNFYALDLRKYGRSIIGGNRMFEVRDISEYYADIDSALSIVRHSGAERIVLMGHSTGGLVTACYLARRGVPADVRALILNSPFLDWNQSAVQEKFLIPAVRSVSRLIPGLNIPQGGDGAYATDLLTRTSFRTDWKLIHSPAVETSWIAAIDAAHDIVQRDPRLCLPILLLHSDRSFRKGDPATDISCTDAVLDVADISRYGRQLGPTVTEVIIEGGIHDLVESTPGPRAATYEAIFQFLNEL